MNDTATIPARRLRPSTVWLGAALLLIAFGLRLALIDSVPPGLQHDEIFKAQEGIALVEQGDFRLFYPSNQGHEGAFVWVLGLSYLLLGQGLLMVKLPAAFFGLLTVALSYRVAGLLFGTRRAAFVSAGLTAVSFWGLYTSRVGLRAVMLPVFALLLVWGLHALSQHPRWRTAWLTGLVLGLAIYTYTASFALYAAFGAYALLMLRAHWRYALLIGGLACLIALPMVQVRLTEPIGQDRVSSISRPLTDALAGRPQELLDNAVKLAGMPAFTGDPEWRYNVADRPLFLLPIGLLVYAGMGLAAWRVLRHRDSALWAALIALTLAALIPSLLTVSAPSYLRSIAAMPPVMLFVALSLSLVRWPRLGWIAALLLVSATAFADLPAYFFTWPRAPEVTAIYRDDLQQLAAYLDANADDIGLALVSTPDTDLDPRIYGFYDQERVPVSFFDGSTSLALSTATDAYVFVSPLSPITPPHLPWLRMDSGAQRLASLLDQNGRPAFAVYRLDTAPALEAVLVESANTPLYVYTLESHAYPRGEPSEWAQPLAYPVNFADVVELLGVELPRVEIATQRDGVNIQLYLRPLVDDYDAPLQAFVHMSRRDSTLHAQRDLLSVPTVQWQIEPGLFFIQDNFVIAGDTPPGRYLVTLGLYDLRTGARLPILDAEGQRLADHLIVGRVRARVNPQP